MVTGGTGALGAAVVRLLVDAGATCHIPTRSERDAAGPRVKIHSGIDLTDEGDVQKFSPLVYGGVLQWMQVPPGDRSSRQQPEQSWR